MCDRCGGLMTEMDVDEICRICGWVRYSPPPELPKWMPIRDGSRRNGVLRDWDEDHYRLDTTGRRGHCLPCAANLRRETPAAYTYKSESARGLTIMTPLCREHMEKKGLAVA